MRRGLASLALLLLAFATYLPGVIRLPAVDRTEIVYAESTRGLLERGELIDPTWRGERHAFRPIGTYWGQMKSAWLRGPEAWSDITTYRIPSLLGVTLAVLATFLMLAPLIGGAPAFIAASLVAVTPIAAVQANLAITEGAVFGFATLAQLALLRLFCAKPIDDTRLIALLFWAALGLSITMNALAVPILSFVTIIAVLVIGRDLHWLSRLRAGIGLPLMLLLGSPWLITRTFVDGIPFSTLTFSEFLKALGGSQDMKLRAAPASFVIASVLGFLPGAVLLIPALKGVWENRAAALQKFLLAWIAGYLIYLELISSKPALYTVQVLFPAFAAAAALALTRGSVLAMPPRALIAHPVASAAFVPAAFSAVLFATGTAPTIAIALAAAAIAALLGLASYAGRSQHPHAWLVLTIAGFALFLSSTFGLMLPHLETPWPAQQIARVTAPLKSCAQGPLAVLGFREPSATFVLPKDTEVSTPAAIADLHANSEPRLAVVEDRWREDLETELKARALETPERLGCIRAFNVMRGCPLSFTVYLTGPAAGAIKCEPDPAFACPEAAPAPQKPGDRCR